MVRACAASAEFGWTRDGRQGRRSPLNPWLGQAERRATVGKTRSCPHCRATILESAAVCPACKPSPPVREPARGGTAVRPRARLRSRCRVNSRAMRRRNPGEYHVVVVIRDAGGAELARKVIGVGGLAPGEERKVELSASRSSTRCRAHDAQGSSELHHFTVRIPPGPDAAGAALRFYNDVLGLESRTTFQLGPSGRRLPHQRGPPRPGSPGAGPGNSEGRLRPGSST